MVFKSLIDKKYMKYPESDVIRNFHSISLNILDIRTKTSWQKNMKIVNIFSKFYLYPMQESWRETSEKCVFVGKSQTKPRRDCEAVSQKRKKMNNLK